MPCRIERLAAWGWGILSCDISWEEFTDRYVMQEFLLVLVQGAIFFGVFMYAIWWRRKREVKARDVAHVKGLEKLEVGLGEGLIMMSAPANEHERREGS
jgi:hypothetical protein